MTIKAYIRGIYTTSLSKLIVDAGGQLYNPSSITRKRLGELRECNDFNLSLVDRNSLQGVRGFGDVEAVKEFRGLLFKELPDVVFWVKGKLRDMVTFKVEFPSLSKRRLDEIRAGVCATLPAHHYAKAFGPPLSTILEEMETKLSVGDLSVKERFQEELDGIRPSSPVEIVHVKLDGRVISLGRGEVKGGPWPLMVIRRAKGSGIYDGLGVRKELGDVMVTEFRKDSFIHRTTYYDSEEKHVKGYYVNISTPVEVYRARIRYVDLEVDVVMKTFSLPQLIDEDLLWRAVKGKVISESLRDRALKEAEKAVKELSELLLH